MTFCGNDIQRRNWTANMYVAEELWSLCRTYVFITVAYMTKSAYKILNAEKYAKPKEVNRMERRKKIITDYRQPGGDRNGENIMGMGC